MQETIAMCMYEVNRLFLKETLRDLPEWNDLSNQLKTYWFALADAALETLQEPDEDMIKAVVKIARKPKPVEKDATWEEIVTAQFITNHIAAIKAAQVDWETTPKKRK